MSALGAGLGGAGIIPQVNAKNFELKQFDEITIVIGDTSTSPIIVKNIKITKDPNETLSKLTVVSARCTGIGIRDSGAGDVRCGLMTSVDNGVNWSQRQVILFNTGGFTASAFSVVDLSMGGDDLTNIGFAFFNAGASTGRIKEAVLLVEVKLPLDYKAELV